MKYAIINAMFLLHNFSPRLSFSLAIIGISMYNNNGLI